MRPALPKNHGLNHVSPKFMLKHYPPKRWCLEMEHLRGNQGEGNQVLKVGSWSNRANVLVNKGRDAGVLALPAWAQSKQLLFLATKIWNCQLLKNRQLNKEYCVVKLQMQKASRQEAMPSPKLRVDAILQHSLAIRCSKATPRYPKDFILLYFILFFNFLCTAFLLYY